MHKFVLYMYILSKLIGFTSDLSSAGSSVPRGLVFTKIRKPICSSYFIYLSKDFIAWGLNPFTFN